MTGEVKTVQHEDGSWHSTNESGLEGIGDSEMSAQSNLLEKVATQPKEVKLGDKVTAVDSFQTEVVRVLVAVFKKPTKIDGKLMTHYAYSSDDPGLQGYGVNESSAKLNLFAKQRDRDEQPK